MNDPRWLDKPLTPLPFVAHCGFTRELALDVQIVLEQVRSQQLALLDERFLRRHALFQNYLYKRKF